MMRTQIPIYLHFTLVLAAHFWNENKALSSNATIMHSSIHLHCNNIVSDIYSLTFRRDVRNDMAVLILKVL